MIDSWWKTKKTQHLIWNLNSLREFFHRQTKTTFSKMIDDIEVERRELPSYFVKDVWCCCCVALSVESNRIETRARVHSTVRERKKEKILISLFVKINKYICLRRSKRVNFQVVAISRAWDIPNPTMKLVRNTYHFFFAHFEMSRRSDEHEKSFHTDIIVSKQKHFFIFQCQSSVEKKRRVEWHGAQLSHDFVA